MFFKNQYGRLMNLEKFREEKTDYRRSGMKAYDNHIYYKRGIVSPATRLQNCLGKFGSNIGNTKRNHTLRKALIYTLLKLERKITFLEIWNRKQKIRIKKETRGMKDIS